MAVHELVLLQVGEELCEHRIALRGIDPHDPGGIAFVDEQAFPACLGMRAHGGMLDVRRFLLLFRSELGARAAFPLARIAVQVRVHRLAAREILPGRFRQRDVGFRHARKQRIAERRAVLHGHLARIEQRSETRPLGIAEVRMPEVARVLAADRFAVLDHVGDDEDLRITGPAAVLPHVVLERAETPAERDVLLGGELLVAKEDDFMLVQRFPDLFEAALVELPRQIDSTDFSAQRCT